MKVAQQGSATRVNWPSLALLVLALIAAAPLWTGPGLVNTRSGGDSPFLFIRLHQLAENLRAGVFPARWMPDAAYGLGYPFFNFYAAVPYYVGALFNLIGFDLLASIKIVQSLGFVLAAGAMYGWARRHFESKSAAWLAAVAYTFAPYHLVNVYVRGDSLSEFYAFVFYPLILWTIDRVVDRPGSRSIASLALAYGGLILTHNISALIFSPFALLYVIQRSVVGGQRSAVGILHSAFGILVGLLVSAWLWLPALSEAPLVQLDAQTTGYFNYAEHFRSANLVQSSLGFDYDTEPPHTPFAMGLVQAILTAAGVAVLTATWKRGAARFRLFVLLGLIVSTLMITPLSKPVWDAWPLLPLTQFPWRFLSVQAVFAALSVGYLATPAHSRTTETQRTRRDISVSLWLNNPALVASWVGLALAASTWLPLRPDYLPMRADEITPQRIQLYEAFTTNIGTTIRAEYLPRTTLPRPYTGPALIDPSAPPRAIVAQGEAVAMQVSREPITQAWSIDAASDSTLAIPTLYFPGWRASLDGQPIETRAAPDLGYIEVDAPAGKHTLSLSLERTPMRAIAEIVSLVAVIGVVAVLAFARGTFRGPAARFAGAWHVAHRLSAWRYEIAVLALASVLAVIATSANAVEARDDNLGMDFESKPWLHHEIESADLNTIAIDHYEYSQLEAGRPFTVSIDWSGPAVPGQLVTVQLVAPSRHAFGGPAPLASSAGAPIEAGVSRHVLHIPASLSKGMYYVRVAGRRAEGGTVAQFLKPIFYAGSATPESQSWARIAGEIELKAGYLKHDDPDQLTVAFDWSALQPIAANYAVSLRLQDMSDRVWVTLDTQPGYGFQPTSAWLPGENQHDVYTLELPPDMPRDAAYSLDVVWYRAASKEEIGRVRVPDISLASTYGLMEVLPPPRSFDVPPMQERVDATFGDAIHLPGYDLKQDGNRLALTLHWQALIDIGADYKFFVHVFDPATETIVAQADAMPGGNAYPTSRWMKGEVVSETFEFMITQPGTYRVATGWYDPNSADRLKAMDAKGNPVATDRVMLGEVIVVP